MTRTETLFRKPEHSSMIPRVTSAPAASFRLVTLGELWLFGADGAALPVRRKDLVLLACIARRSPRVVRREELAALLWGERDEAKARQSLRTALLQLRRALGEGFETKPESVRLAEGVLELDATALEREVAEGCFAEAAARWKGDFLRGAEDAGGESYRSWLEGEREGLRRRLAWALERLVERAVSRGDWSDAASWSDRWSQALPLDERAHRHLVEALRMAGRPDEALARHAVFITRLKEGLGLDPSSTFLRLAAQIERSGRRVKRAPRPSSAAILTPAMVGRRAALGELTSAWRAAAKGDGAVVLVEGEEGLGKTRLFDELVRWVSATTPDAVLLRAKAYEAEREAPWTASWHLLAALADAPGLIGAPEEALAEVSRVVPAIRERVRSLSGTGAATGAPPGTPGALAQALARVLGEVASEAPVLLALDDFPWADAETQAVLRALIRRPPPGVLQLYTGRPEALEALQLSPELRQARVHRVRLAALAAEEVEEMMASMVEMPAAERRRLAERLHAESDGNPYYVAELVAGLAEAGALSLGPDGTWRAAPGAAADAALPLPAGVREAVRDRLDRLTTVGRAALDAAAVLGRRAPAEQLAAAANLPDDELAAALDELTARQLLREPAGAPGSLEFTHEVTRRVAYELLPAGRRQALHRAAAAAATTPAARDYHRQRAGLPPEPAPAGAPAAPPAPAAEPSRRLTVLAAAAALVLLLLLLLVALGVLVARG